MDVNCTAFIPKLGPFSEKDMEYYISIVLLCGWKDERLPSPNNQSVMVDESYKNIWRPTIWPMVHADILKKEDVLYPVLHPGSVVYLMQRFDFRVPCLMQLYTYPHDRQMCSLILGFVGGIKVRWQASQYFQSDDSPIIISMPHVRSVFRIDKVDFNSFTLNVRSYKDTCIYQSGSCDYSGYDECLKMGVKCFKAENLNTTSCLKCLQKGGKCANQTQDCSPYLDKVNLVGDFHTTLELRFGLSRSLGYQILHTYVPSSCVVAISWVSFWLDPASAPARTGLGVTTVLTMVTLSTKVSPAPELNYIRAIDIWVIGCKIFVVLALLEYAFVNYASRQTSKAPKSPETTADEGEVEKWKHSLDAKEESLDGTNDFQLPKLTFTGYKIAKKLDYVSRFLFPAGYIAFVITYFVVFTSADQ
ncbi:glycine receptor subunit alpha-1-like [Branchiostoma lanceolatum]|uniref:glycine receptor subunit alpha-1-like n=1 Tax=Branchiostoma lanceolatum TaxID=7740 RepID=UPI003452D6D3